MLRTPLALAAFVSILCVSLAAPAQGQKAAPATAPALLESGGTLTSLAGQLGQRLQTATPVLVVVGPVVEDEPTEKGGPEQKVPPSARWVGLHEKLRLVVGSAVPSAAARATQMLSLADARRHARARGLSLVYLSPLLRAGHLHLVADWVEWPRLFWQKALLPEGVVRQHLSLSAPIDGEVRSFLPRPSKLLTRKKGFISPLPDVLALSCGRESSGDLSLVIVGRREIIRGRFVRSTFSIESRRSWSDLSPLAAAPLRAPIAAARFRNGAVEVGSSDRAYVVRLDRQLRLLERANRAFPLEMGECAPFSDTGVASRAQPCAFEAVSASPPPASAAVASDAESVSVWLEARFSTTAGVPTAVRVLQSSQTGEAQLDVFSPLNSDRHWALGTTGGAAALGDLDGDGTAELIRSSATRDPVADVLQVHSIGETELSARAKVDFPSVQALAVCPFDGSNPLALIVATNDRLWVLT